jgi:hypothetical protein
VEALPTRHRPVLLLRRQLNSSPMGDSFLATANSCSTDGTVFFCSSPTSTSAIITTSSTSGFSSTNGMSASSLHLAECCHVNEHGSWFAPQPVIYVIQLPHQPIDMAQRKSLLGSLLGLLLEELFSCSSWQDSLRTAWMAKTGRLGKCFRTPKINSPHTDI